MISYQMTSFLCFCLSGIWLVHGKPSSAAILPQHENQYRRQESRDPLTLDINLDKSYTPSTSQASDSDLLYLSTPILRNQILVQDLAQPESAIRKKRTPSGFSARGFHEGVFDRDFGHFSPVKRRPEADASGFYGDTFSNGFGEFETMKRDGSYLNEDEIRQLLKRTEMGANGFHGDTFNQGFGNFDTMKKRLSSWLDGRTIKRKPEMTKSGFHGDVFNSGFGEFHPMKK